MEDNVIINHYEDGGYRIEYGKIQLKLTYARDAWGWYFSLILGRFTVGYRFKKGHRWLSRAIVSTSYLEKYASWKNKSTN